jgi:hypothetical protein
MRAAAAVLPLSRLIRFLETGRALRLNQPCDEN